MHFDAKLVTCVLLLTVLNVFEYITKEIKRFIGNRDIIKNIYGVPVYDTIISGYFCI